MKKITKQYLIAELCRIRKKLEDPHRDIWGAKNNLTDLINKIKNTRVYKISKEE
jgi:hypothetical protein